MLKQVKPLATICITALTSQITQAQFFDSFDGEQIDKAWNSYTGDGSAEVDFVQKDGFARLLIDATQDKHNVWWAIIKRDISSYLDLSKLEDPSYELRVEAKVRVGNAPRRLNMMVNTQRTTNYHIDLREFDIPDTTDWHIISMTTTDLDAVEGDAVNVQLAATDWGLGKYHVDIDYYRADIVNIETAGPEKGEPLIYHPPVPETNTFSHHLTVAHDTLINSDFPNVNFNDWLVQESNGFNRILTVSANQWPILRWDLSQYSESKADGTGVLELTTHSVMKGGDFIKAYGEDLGIEFGKIRVIEIFGGDANWDQNTVTYQSFMKGEDPIEVFNSQMTFDAELSGGRGGKTYITLPRPVMQRLLDGTTKGLLIRPLGALDASFYASEADGEHAPKLHFNPIE